MTQKLQITECPRDAMQGIHEFIPTELKISYLNALLKVGFPTLDFGSFVSPKAIPQMADTHEIVDKLDLDSSETKLLAIIANTRGAEQACNFERVSYLGFPYSASKTFQERNTNANQEIARQRLSEIVELADKNNKEVIAYISMAFGNPYGDTWNAEVIQEHAQYLADLGVKTISLADTVGVAKAEDIKTIFGALVPAFDTIEFTAHLHTTPYSWEEKLKAVVDSGCRKIDGAIKGFGGCPMAKDDLTGNLATENILKFAKENKLETGIDESAFNTAFELSNSVFMR